MPYAYYNEIDESAAAWLTELIAAGHIPDGFVDTRSIWDVAPEDLREFTQLHFFAGIGGWAYALQLAGWPADRPVWTGSCPCQPFSAAGQGAGFADERHLWPAWHHLIRVCRPSVIFGEQVEAAIGHGWLDLVQADLEGEGYACGFVGVPAAGVGAPHIRQRLWFVANTEHAERRSVSGPVKNERDGQNAGREEAHGQLGACRAIHDLADTDRPRRRARRSGEASDGREPTRQQPAGFCAVGELGNAGGSGLAQQRSECRASCSQTATDTRQTPIRTSASTFWSDCDWLPCLDGKSRPVEPGTFPLAHGVSARVGRLRGFGNAIVPQVAAEVIRAYLGVE